MEVHGRQPNDRRSEGAELRKSDRARTRASQKAVQAQPASHHEAVEEARRAATQQRTTDVSNLGASGRDVIDFSPAARSADGTDDPKRLEKLENLKLAYQNGTLNSPELIDRAAESILSQ